MIEDLIYKQIDGIDMKCRVYSHAGKKMNDAILFYFGGGWVAGTIDQFQEHCKYFAKLGFTCIAIDYRVESRQGVTPFECVDDCRDSLKWVIEHYETLNINPKRIIMAGASAGGHLVAMTATLYPELIDGIVRGLVLFNPVVDTSEIGFGNKKFLGRELELSPVHTIRQGLPNTLIIHGTADETVPYENVVRYKEKMAEAGNSCELISYEGAGHGFFNHFRDMTYYHRTLKQMEAFVMTL